MQILFHIGTDKTGTTAIQQQLILNREWFHARSIYIPGIGFGKSNGHSALLSNLDEEHLTRLGQEIEDAEQAGFSSVLLSWEGMNFFPLKKIKRLQEVASGHDRTILVYLREQAEMIQTGFLQQLKSTTNKAPMNDFERSGIGIHRLRSRRLRYPPTRDYYQLLSRWQRGMPGAKYMVRTFARKNLVNGDIVDDFLAQLGLVADEQFDRSTKHANISLDVESGIVVDRWQREGLPRAELLRRIDVAISNIARNGPGSKYFLSEITVAQIRRYYRASNRKVAREFLNTDDELFPSSSNCWRDNAFAAIEQRAEVVARQLAVIDRTPTLANAGNRGDVLASVSLEEGWHGRKNWGAWSRGLQSTIRFRIWRRRIGPTCTGLRILLRGRYAGGNTATRVIINEHDYGDVNLSAGGAALELPLELLMPYETVEIYLHHTRPVTPQQRDNSADRESIAFGLEKVAYQYLNSEGN
jgi:hypothetical protein